MSFKRKKRIKFVTLASGLTMKFEDRLAYSFLLARSKGLSMTRLAKLSRLDRTSTLPKVLSRLVSQGLAEKKGCRYHGLPSDLVRIDSSRHAAEKWYERVCYLKYYLPTDSCPLSKKQLAVYYLIHAGKSGTSLIAHLLGISRPTVVEGVKVLKKHRLLDPLGDPVSLTEDKLAWWVEKDNTAKRTEAGFDNFASQLQPLMEAFERHPAEWISLHPWRTVFNQFGKLCGQYGYSHKAVVSLLEKVAMNDLGSKPIPIAKVFRDLPKLVQKAEDSTEKNRRTREYRGISFGTFSRKLGDLVQAERRWKPAG